MPRSLIAICLFSAVLPGSVMAQGKGIRLWNLTTATISGFQLSPAGKDNWGPNQTLNDRDKEVDHDERLRITGVEPGRYDAKVGYRDSRQCVVRDIDIKADAVTCTIASKTFTPPATTCKDDSAGHTVVLDAHGVSMPCAQGGMPGVAPAGTPVLFYGSSSTVGRYTCTSATNGVTCTDNHGVGFRLAREALVTLP